MESLRVEKVSFDSTLSTSSPDPDAGPKQILRRLNALELLRVDVTCK